MTTSRAALAGFAVLALAAGLVLDCTRHSGTARRGAPADSSFAATTGSRGPSPLERSLASGQATYQRYCVICHGQDGGGDGFNAYNVKSAFSVNPTAFSDSGTMAGLRDADALKAIREGGPAVGKSTAMPPWGHTLTPGEIAEVWRYARSLASAPAGR
jgi:cytochrome c oxidase cbb3-type subunit 3